MLKLCKTRCLLAVLLIITIGAQAQDIAPMDPAAITNDKTGKYVALDHKSQFLLEQDWFSQMHCAQATDGFVSATIGTSLFHIPQKSLRSMMIGRALLLEKAPDGSYRTWHLANTGCPENPIQAVLAEVIPPGAGPAAELGIRETPAHPAGARKLTEALAELREHPNSNCGNLSDEFLSCVGKINGQNIAMVMAKDKRLFQADGAPLSMRCRMEPTVVCGVDEELDGGISIVAPMPDGPAFLHGLTVSKLKDYQDQLRHTVDNLRGVK